MKRRIHLGCGKDYKKDWINIDKSIDVKCDIRRDLEKGLPFDDDSVDEVYARHFIEHIADDVFLMNEIWRVCKNGARVELGFPVSSGYAAHDWGHKSYWNPRKIHYLTKRNRTDDTGLVCDFKLIQGEDQLEGDEPLVCKVIKVVLEVVK